MKGLSSNVIIAACIFFGFATAQQSGAPECPDTWVSRNTKCYFFSEISLTWQDSKIFCERRDAELISVNGQDEHNMVQEQLLRKDDGAARNLWYTGGRVVSGQPENPTFGWLDGSGLGSGREFWKDDLAPISPDGGDYIVYIYSDEGDQVSQPGYVWVKRAGTDLFRFICEIDKSDTEKIISNDRDFVFGLDNIHPDEIFRGPYFMEQPKSILFDESVDVVVTTARSVSFVCEAMGFPQPTYKWYEGATTETSQRVNPIDTEHITTTNGHLNIHNPDKTRDIQPFWCTAENGLGTVRSESGSINFVTLEEFPKTVKTIRAEERNYAVIPCVHTNAVQTRLQFDWFKDGDRNRHVSSVYDNHLFISLSGSLYFSSVAESDAGAYHCAINLEGGGGEVRTSMANNLIVDTSNAAQQIEPDIHNDFPKVLPNSPTRGETVFLECFARGTIISGSLVYTWSRTDGEPMPSRYLLEDLNRRMIIPNAGLEDEREYRCTVSYGGAEDSETVRLVLSAKPFFGLGGLEDQHIDEGAEFTWRCAAAGNPKPTYKWLKNGQPFDPVHLPANGPGRITFTGINGETDSTTVTFTRVNKAYDLGMYQCAATNSLGTTYSTAQMRILEFGPSFVKHPGLGQVIATVGGNATIPCDPEAAPAADVIWLRDGQEFQYGEDSNSARRKLPNGHLFMSNIQREDAGTYSCVATNPVLNEDGSPSEARISIPMQVVQRTFLQYGQPSDDTVLLYDQVTLQCRANYDYLLDLVYIWYHNNRLIDFDDWKMAQIYERGTGVSRGDLIIKNITYEERGQFRCVGQTKSDQAANSAIITVVGPPGEPAGIKAGNPTTNSVVVAWTQGAINGDHPSSFIVEKFNEYTQEWMLGKKVNESRDISAGNTTVRGLFASTAYQFRVKAKNKYGVGVPSVASAQVRTSPSRPTSYPKNISGGGGKVGTLVIRWTPLPREEWNADSVGYRAQYKEYNDGRDTGSWRDCGGSRDNPDPVILLHGSAKSGHCVVTLGADYFHTLYWIRVFATNNIGDAQGDAVPEPVKAWSAVKVPSQTPTNIVAQPYNSTALTVYWDPVPNDRQVTGGELKGFYIVYYKDGTDITFAQRATILNNVTEGLIIGLEPNTDYVVNAQMFNSAGDGITGDKFVQTTWLKAPQSMPEYVTLNKTDGGIGVYFRGVVTSFDEEPLDGYKVRIWRQGDNIRSVKDYDCGRRTWIIIEDSMEKETRYNLRVFGYSRGGVGKMSSPLIQFTIGCNQEPSDPEARWISLCDGCSNTLSAVLICATTLLHFIHNYL